MSRRPVRYPDVRWSWSARILFAVTALACVALFVLAMWQLR